MDSQSHRRKFYTMMKPSSFASNDANDAAENGQNEDKKLSNLQSRLMTEKHRERKLKRVELVNELRKLSSTGIAELDDEEAADTSHKQENETIKKPQTIFEDTTLIARPVKTHADQELKSFQRPTVISSTRRQLLEQWLNEKRERDKQKDRRPVFKVYHLDPKIYDVKLPESSTFTFNMNVQTSSMTSHSSHGNLHKHNKPNLSSNDVAHRPITRSYAKRDLKLHQPSQSDFFSNVKIDILNRADTYKSSLAAYKSNHPKSSSTSSLSSRQFAPLPPPPQKIEPITASHANHNQKTTRTASMRTQHVSARSSSKATNFEKEVESIMSRMGDNVFISPRAIIPTQPTNNTLFVPSLSSTILEKTKIIEPSTDKSNMPSIDEFIAEKEESEQPNEIIVDQQAKHDMPATKDTEQNIAQLQDNQQIKEEIVELNIEPLDQNKSNNESDKQVNISNQTINIVNTQISCNHEQIRVHAAIGVQNEDTNIEVFISDVQSKTDNSQHDNQVQKAKFDTESIRQTIHLLESIDFNTRNVKYYRDLVQAQTNNLNDMSAKFLSICDEMKLAEDIDGDIRSACGLAQLLIKERFVQFTELIEQCEMTNEMQESNNELPNGTKPVMCSDLQGFWDMVDYQIKDIEKKFAHLRMLKDNNFVLPIDNFVPKLANESKPSIKKIFNKPNLAKPKTASSGVISKFSQFRAKLKAGNNNQDEIPIQLDIVTKPEVQVIVEKTPKPNPIIQINDNQVTSEKAPKSVTRKSIRNVKIPDYDIFNELDNQESAQANKRYNLRSRPSDLMKFDSPLINKDTIQTPTSNKKTRKSLARKSIGISLSNKENLKACDEEDLFGIDDEKPISFQTELDKDKGFASSIPNTLRRSFSNTPIRTPVRQSSLHPGQPSNILNSPLLKLAFISSHGKRVSLGFGVNK